MEFRETLLAAQRNQQQKSSDNAYYKARLDPPKKEQKQKDRLSDNIKKFLAKKEEEERQKQLEAKRKREELHAMRDPKMLRKIQKTLKVIKSANKSVLAEAVDRDNTAVTLQGPDQPDQDDYGYESQEAAAIYQKMMEKYSKLPDEPKFPTSMSSVKRDLAGTRERVKHALQHEEEPVPHKRKRRTGDQTDRELSPENNIETDKQVEEKTIKPKIRKAAPPPMDFNQLLKLAEQKKSEPLEVPIKKPPVELETDRPMTKKQKKEYEEEMARRMRRQQRAEQTDQKVSKDERSLKEKNRKPEINTSGFTRIPKLSDKNSTFKVDSISQQKVEKSKARIKTDTEKYSFEKERFEKQQKERIEKEMLEKVKCDREKYKLIDKVKLEKDRIIKERIHGEKSTIKSNNEPIQSYSKIPDKSYRDRQDKGYKEKVDSVSREPLSRPETSKNLNPKTVNTYRIDKNANEKKMLPSVRNGDSKTLNGHSMQGKLTPKNINNSKLSLDESEKLFSKHKAEMREKILAKKNVEIRDKVLAKQSSDIRDRTKQSSDIRDRIKQNSDIRDQAKQNSDTRNKMLARQSAEARDKLIRKQNAEARDMGIKQSTEVRDKILAKQKALFGSKHENALSNSPKPINGNIKPYNDKGKLLDNKNLPSRLKSEQKLSNDTTSAKPGTQLKVPSHFDFDKYMLSLKGEKSGLQKAGSTRQSLPADVKRKLDDMRKKQMQKKRIMNSDSEYDSEMDDFIDDGEEDLDYSKHIKEIFGYDRSRYNDMDDDDDPNMESSFARQMREEFISKKIGIMEDLEDMRQEAMEKKMKTKRRRIDD